MSGTVANILTAIERIEKLGRTHGFYLESEKSQFVSELGVVEDVAPLATAPLDCAQREGGQYMGVFVGTTKAKRTWVEDKVYSWVAGVRRLVGFSRLFS